MAKAVRQRKNNGGNGDAPKRTSAMKTQAEVLSLEDAIRVRAYELYQQRGGEHGSDQDDWFRAETEVRSRFSQKAS